MKKTLISFAAAFLSICAVAQSFQEGFFLDGYTLGYRFNPALSNEGSFLSLGQWNDQSRNNFGAASFLYPQADGTIVTALHESVSPDTFLGSLQADNYFNRAAYFNLFSHGWRRDAAYHTIEANIRGMYSASIPMEIFKILKLGTGDVNYDLCGAKLSGQAYVELAYGYSRDLSDIISVGARAKLLLGVESFHYNVTSFDMEFTGEAYTADIEADLDMTSRMGKIREGEDGYLNLKDISLKDKWRLPAGAGLAFDLGVIIRPLDGLTVSLSALDLGALLWYYGNAGKSQGKAEFTGVKDLSFDDIKQGDITGQFTQLKDDFINSIKLKPVQKHILFETVPATLNAGVKYELPFYRKVSVGLTGNLMLWSNMSYKEVRAGAAWAPCREFSMTANIGTGDFGPVYGLALSAKLDRFRIYGGLQNGFGGTIPYTSTPLRPNNKLVTVGLAYDL